MRRDYIYEVRGTNDPIDGDKVIFDNGKEALDYAIDFPEAKVYMVELEIDDVTDTVSKVAEHQIKGPEVTKNLNDPNIPNSCDADNPDCYDENGNFRLPINAEDDFSDIDEGCDDRRGHDPINRRERVNSELAEGFSEKLVRDVLRDAKDEYDRYKDETDEPIEYFIGQSADSFGVPFDKWYIFFPDHISEEDAEFKAFKRGYEANGGLVDDMTDEEFVEALYNALATKREEAPFPEDKLDMDPPADDVPVVKCKITPLATHSEDEKPLNEDVDNLTSIFNWEAADVKLDYLGYKKPAYLEFPEITEVAFTVKFISADGKIVLPVKFYSNSAEVLYSNIDCYYYEDSQEVKTYGKPFIKLNLDKEDAFEIENNADIAKYVTTAVEDDLSLGSDYIDALDEAIDQEEHYLENLVKTDVTIDESLTKQVEDYLWEESGFWQDYFEADIAEKSYYDESKSSEVTKIKLNETLYNDTDIDWKEPDPNTVEITYCRENATVGGPINISAGYSVDFVTESGIKVYVGVNFEEVHLWQDKDYEVDLDEETVTLLKPIDQIFNFDIDTIDLDYDDVVLSDMIDKIEDYELSFEDQKAAQEEFFAYKLSTDKNIINKVKELLEKAIYRTNFKEDAIEIAKYDLDESIKKNKLTESDPFNQF